MNVVTGHERVDPRADPLVRSPLDETALDDLTVTQISDRTTNGIDPALASVSVGIFAHNEEEMVGSVIDAFLEQVTSTVEICQIIVVSCGSTDGTVARADKAAAAASLVSVIDRPRRDGKIKAIEAFLEQATSDIVVVSGADTLPTPDAVERLAGALSPPVSAGMSGGRVRPISTPVSLVGQLHEVLWELNHLVARRRPKLGEIVATRRNLLRTLPVDVHCDEVVLEWMVSTTGFELFYDEKATVHNSPPPSVSMLYRQRRRIACQHQAAIRHLDYTPSTMELRSALWSALELLRREPGRLFPVIVLGALEATARVQGYLDYHHGQRYATWQAVPPTVSASQAERA